MLPRRGCIEEAAMTFQTRLTPAMIERYGKAGFWGQDTIYKAIERTARTHPEREALYDRTHRLTYAQLLAKVNRVAAVLAAQGIGPGDVVTIQIPNWVEYACVFFALERLGAVANPVSVDFRSRELEYILRFSESRAFIGCDRFKGFDHSAMIARLRPGSSWWPSCAARARQGCFRWTKPFTAAGPCPPTRRTPWTPTR
jgi:non-ribosomal peptide synthetase component E (peptide arylation enzyme)